MFAIICPVLCPHRLTARTSGSHPGNRGSIPRGGANLIGAQIKQVSDDLLFCFYVAAFLQHKDFLSLCACDTRMEWILGYLRKPRNTRKTLNGVMQNIQSTMPHMLHDLIIKYA